MIIFVEIHVIIMWWIIVGLFIAGIVFMLVEFLLIPGIGLAGILSLASFGASCWMAFSYIGDTAGWWVLGVNLTTLVVLLVIMLRAKTWRKFGLSTEVASKVNEEPSLISAGERGFAQTRLAPMGNARFGEVICEVKSFDNSMISAGTPLEVVEVRDNQVIVKAI